MSASPLLDLLGVEDLDLAGRLRTTFPVVVPWACSVDGRGLEREEVEEEEDWLWLKMKSARLTGETGGGKRTADTRFGSGCGMAGIEEVVVVTVEETGPTVPSDTHVDGGT